MNATTLTGQQRAVAVLAAIVTVPGLPEATWTVWTSQNSAAPAIEGQLDSGTLSAIRAAVTAYASEFALAADNEKFIPSRNCESFTRIRVSGVVDGVHVKVWGPAR